MDRREEVVQAAATRLRHFDVVADHSWDLDLAVVLEVAAANETLILKGHAEQRRYSIEVGAYREVVPAIADRAPTLRWADGAARVIAITRLPGRHLAEASLTEADERSMFRDAGEVLRRLHSAKPPVELTGWQASKIEGLERWVRQAPPGLLDRSDVSFARAQVSLLVDLPSPVGVSCHGDWQPRNWLITPNGTVRTYDFERVGVDWWCHDLQRMWWREWSERPDLAEAHFEGYGRAPNDEELAMLMATSAASHITQIVWATVHGDRQFAEAGRRHLRTMRATA